MHLRTTLAVVMLAGGGAALALAAEAITQNQSVQLAVEGSASFTVDTNIPAVSIEGKSSALKARVSAHREPAGLQIDRIEASVPVKTLQTGMGVRDEHMRKYIFTTKDGQTPDMQFVAENVTCNPGAQAACNVAGNLTIRGVSHPFNVPLRVREERGGFKAAGESVIKLSDYNIEQPTQFGVKTSNQVQVRLDFNARQVAAQQTSGGGSR